LHKKDEELLNRIKSFFNGVGSVRITNAGTATYTVESLKTLNSVIIPHFLNFPLTSKKKADFLLFNEVINLMNNGEHLSKEGIVKILSYAGPMNKGLSEKFHTEYPGISLAQLPVVESPQSLDPNWLVGFTDAEGCFFVNAANRKDNSLSIHLKFELVQNIRDALLLDSFVGFFDCGYIIKIPINNTSSFVVTKLSEVASINSFFARHPLQSSKKLDYLDFCKVAELMHNKLHLTEEGKTQIVQIKSGMNRKRANKISGESGA